VTLAEIALGKGAPWYGMPSGLKSSGTLHPYSFLKENLKMPPGLSTRYNRPRSIYQYINIDPRLSGQNCKFLRLPFVFQVSKETWIQRKQHQTWKFVLKALEPFRIQWNPVNTTTFGP